MWFLSNESHDGQLVFGVKRPVLASGKPIRTDGDAGPLVVDWDGDGIPDLIVGSSDGSVTFFKGSGTQGVPELAAGVALIPASDEKHHEVIHQALDPQTNELLLPALERPSMRSKLAVYDWNGDGKLDLIVGDAVSMIGPEPELTAEQKKERDEIESQTHVISEEISKRFTGAEEQARRELNLSDEQRWEPESQQQIAERADEILKATTEYRDLYRKLDPLSKRLAPLRAKYSTHGFVWVYLRK